MESDVFFSRTRRETVEDYPHGPAVGKELLKTPTRRKTAGSDDIRIKDFYTTKDTTLRTKIETRRQ